jgi:hypothetical protein
MIELSARTIACVDALFSGDAVARAKELLIHQCGSNVPFCEENSPIEMERIRLAAVKLSNGSYAELKKAVELGCTDWRDLLMAAGFGHDTEAHHQWVP